MSYSVRPFTADDFAVVTALYHMAKPLGMSPPDEVWEGAVRCVAVAPETGHVIGYGAVSGENPSSLVLIVHPEWQRQGIAGALGAWMRPILTARGVTAVEPWVREENAAGNAWLTKHGFTPTKLDGPVRLTLPEAKMTPFEPIKDTMTAQGITVTTLAEEREHDTACLSKLHQLDREINGRPPASTEELEDFIAELEPAGQGDQLLFHCPRWRTICGSEQRRTARRRCILSGEERHLSAGLYRCPAGNTGSAASPRC